jgi:predicted cupin superfamily sugar epimerase
MWHFYAGGPLEVIELTPAGERRSTILGGGLRRGERLQYVVEAGNWFGARPLAGSAFSFVGCTVAPGFDFRDFELARAADLVRRFPEHEALIRSLTRAP